MMRLPYGEEIMIVGRTIWTQSTSVTDRRTDQITITKTVQRRASHGKNSATMDNVYGATWFHNACQDLEENGPETFVCIECDQ